MATDIAAVVGKCVRRLRAAGRFATVGHLDEHDLHADAMDAVKKALPKFNPAKANLSTFVYLVAWRRLVSLGRQWARRNQIERDSGRYLPEAVTDPDRLADSTAAEDWIDERTPAEWAAEVYAAALEMYPRRGRGFARFSTAAAYTLAAVAWRYQMSATEIAHKLNADNDLRTAIELPRPPSKDWVARAIRNHGAEIQKIADAWLNARPVKRLQQS